jgi:hypothetical protein
METRQSGVASDQKSSMDLEGDKLDKNGVISAVGKAKNWQSLQLLLLQVSKKCNFKFSKFSNTLICTENIYTLNFFKYGTKGKCFSQLSHYLCIIGYQ